MSNLAIRLYEAYGFRYSHHCQKTNYSSPRHLFEAVRSRTPVHGAQVLDIGIGTGESSRLFKESGAHITGIDGSQTMLGQCAKNNPEATLYRQDLSINPYLDFDDASFDLVISNCVFRYLRDISQLVREMSRVTRLDGIVAFTTTSPKEKQVVRDWDGSLIESKFLGCEVKEYIHCPQSLEECLQNAGLRVLEEKTIESQTLENNTKEYCQLFLAKPSDYI